MLTSDGRYEEIKNTVADLIERLVIITFPLDIFDICRQLGIKLVRYSDIPISQRSTLKLGSEDALHVLWELSKGVFEYTIYYNDDLPAQRTRFSLVHEIAHIILGHLEHSDLAESEANFFAAYLLAPPPLIDYLKISDYTELAVKFNLSYTCAFNSMQRYIKWKSYGSNVIKPYERKIIEAFKTIL